MPRRFAALIAYDADATTIINATQMTEATNAVVADEVTQRCATVPAESARFSKATGSDSPVATASSRGLLGGGAGDGLLDVIVGESAELVTMVDRSDADDAVTEQIVGGSTTTASDIHVDVHHGGQPLYPYLFESSERMSFRDLAEIDVGRLKVVGDKKRGSLAAVGIDNLLDLVTFYPERWSTDRTKPDRDLVPGKEALVLATVRSVTKRVTRNRRTIVNVNVGDGSAAWRWSSSTSRGASRPTARAADRAVRQGRRVSRRPPDGEPVRVDLIGDRTGRIVPIYPQSEKVQINTWEIAGWVEEALRRCRDRRIADPVPSVCCNVSTCSADSTRCRTSTCPSRSATRNRRAPARVRRTAPCAARAGAAQAGDRTRSARYRSRSVGDLVQRFHDALPYPLTGAQRRAIDEVDVTLQLDIRCIGCRRRCRLGKTVVAVDTMMVAVQAATRRR